MGSDVTIATSGMGWRVDLQKPADHADRFGDRTNVGYDEHTVRFGREEAGNKGEVCVVVHGNMHKFDADADFGIDIDHSDYSEYNDSG